MMRDDCKDVLEQKFTSGPFLCVNPLAMPIVDATKGSLHIIQN